MYEHKKQPLASKKIYYFRIARNLFYVFLIMCIMLTIGTVGYMYSGTGPTSFLDAFHNAAMILSGMGPVITEHFTDGGKLFSAFYALFSGIVFISAIGLILAPTVHRLFHRLHLEED
jgi:uncharacterized membrane protein